MLAVTEPRPAPRMTAALETVPAAFVCLAAARRPADFPAEVGWLATEAWDPPLHLSAVLRSWEDRFGARVLQIGAGAEIRLLVSGPRMPRWRSPLSCRRSAMRSGQATRPGTRLRASPRSLP